MLEQIKNYLRISHNYDDEYILTLIDMVIDLIKTQSGVEYNTNDTIYTHAIIMGVAHYYDNRASVTDKKLEDVPYTLNSLIATIGVRGAYDK